MVKCQKCGCSIPDNSKFCSNCGEKININPAPAIEVEATEVKTEHSNFENQSAAHTETKSETPNFTTQNSGNNTYSKNAGGTTQGRPAPPIFKKRPMHDGMLAWSIVNTAIGFFSCCSSIPTLVLGIIAIIMTVGARDCRTAEEEVQKIKIAKILNIVASALFAVSVILWVIAAITIPGTIHFKTPGINMFPYSDFY